MTKLAALNDTDGKPVDWWFIYKLPTGVGSGPAEGFNYLYYDSNTSGELALSPKTLDKGDSALHNTLRQVFEGDRNKTDYIVYNDENPRENVSNNSLKGHVKGGLAFNKSTDSAILLTHSTPRFPAVDEIELPEKEQRYGQTYLCVTLENYSTANQLAHQLRHMHQPQITAFKLGADILPGEDLYQLAHGDKVEVSGLSSMIEFQSRAGKTFHSFAKNRRWGKNFWLELVAPALQGDLMVESWIRGAIPPDEEKGESIEDIFQLDFTNIGLDGISWKETKDHAKWAISMKGKKKWICVGDLNRMISQEKRGGGTIAFQEPNLWKSLFGAHSKIRDRQPGD